MDNYIKFSLQVLLENELVRRYNNSFYISLCQGDKRKNQIIYYLSIKLVLLVDGFWYVKSFYKIYYKFAIKIIFKNYNNNMKYFIVREYGR